MPVLERQNTDLRDVAKNPYLVTCDVSGCNLSMAAPTINQAESLLKKHNCPWVDGAVLPIGSKTLLEELWSELDATMDKLMVNPTADLKQYARGVAYGIAVFSQPYFNNVKEVSQEASFRWKMRNGQMDERPTPGCGHYNPAPDIWRPAPDKAGGFTSQPIGGGVAAPTFSDVPSARPRQTSPRAGYKIFDQEIIENIKHNMASGLFSAAQVAQVFGCPESQIKEIVGS